MGAGKIEEELGKHYGFRICRLDFLRLSNR